MNFLKPCDGIVFTPENGGGPGVRLAKANGDG